MNNQAQRYVVIGAGAVGTALAVSLHDAGHEVVLVARGTAYETIAAGGVRFARPAEQRTVRLPVASGPDDVAPRGGDVLVLATKAQHVVPTLEQWFWRPLASGGGTVADLPVVTPQNGLVSEQLASRYLRTVIGATTLVAARHLVPGEVQVTNAPRLGQLLLGPWPAAQAGDAAYRLTHELAADLDAAGWLTQAVDDIERWKSWKLLHNVTNAIEVLAGNADDLAALGAHLVAEARTVLTGAGYTFADPSTERRFDPELAAVDPGNGHRPGRQSTWQSFVRGTSSEVDYLNGEIVLQARRAGLAAPFNAAVQRVLARSAAAGEPPGTRTVDEVAALAAQLASPAPTHEGAST
ncbi:2-dehydropantoate 2-reductase N-terminal domain-containing protein [Saccharomonospora sp. NPDC046836]|uniref:ketopantoate reductase family protein n=1 Tax=Saccharomonospora sp. NPDC046836 TaxID=3156921 RepID=UPI00340BAF96